MSMIFSLGTKSHDVFVFKNLVENYGETKSADEIKSLLYSSAEAEFDKDLYDKAISLSVAKSVNFKYDTASSSKYKHGAFTGRNKYKDSNGTIDTSIAYSKPIEGWLTTDPSTSDYSLFSSSSGDTFYIATKDFTPGLIISDFSPLYNKLMELQLKKYDSPQKDTNKSNSGATSFKNYMSDLVRGKNPKSSLSLNSLVDSKYFNLKKATDISYKATKQAKKVQQYGEFLKSHSKDEIAEAIIDRTPILGELKSNITTLKNNLSSIKSSLGGFGLPENGVKEFNTAASLEEIRQKGLDYKSGQIKPINKTQSEEPWLNYKNKATLSKKDSDLNNLLDNSEQVQAILYSVPPLQDSSDKYNYANRVVMLGCLQQPEQISYSVEASYEPQSPRGSQTPYQFYQNDGQISLSFDLKWHIDEVRDGYLTGNNKDGLQHVAQMAEDFARPWAFGGSVQPKVCRVILPSISEVGYISSVNVTYSGDLTSNNKNERDAGFNRLGLDTTDKEGNIITRKNTSHEVMSYTYNELTISFTMLVIRDVALQQGTDIEKNTVDFAKITTHKKSDLENLTFNNQDLPTKKVELYKNEDGTITADTSYTNRPLPALDEYGHNYVDENGNLGFDFSDIAEEEIAFQKEQYALEEQERFNNFDFSDGTF